MQIVLSDFIHPATLPLGFSPFVDLFGSAAVQIHGCLDGPKGGRAQER
jgi:hypothetical protein